PDSSPLSLHDALPIFGSLARLALTREHANPERATVCGETIAAVPATGSEVTGGAVGATAVAVRFLSVRSSVVTRRFGVSALPVVDRKSTRLNSSHVKR